VRHGKQLAQEDCGPPLGKVEEIRRELDGLALKVLARAVKARGKARDYSTRIPGRMMEKSQQQRQHSDSVGHRRIITPATMHISRSITSSSHDNAGNQLAHIRNCCWKRDNFNQ